MLIVSLFLINFVYFGYRYFVFYPIYAASDWQYGYQQAAQIASQYEDQVDKIVFTSHYGQPHVFTYFYQKRNPLYVFWGEMVKYLYRDINWEEDKNLTNTLLIGSPEEIPEDAEGLIKEIKFPDGSSAFRVVRVNANQ